ncbi:hypothetical protein GCM10009114_18620 [Aliiglaciecola litoralis]|uniref:O-antigen ligase-related domain-containing protein n=2 Tax=Aliiglaciecola litoralis TaxID=582857 RepID=A0ABP3WXZ7_9ALTE
MAALIGFVFFILMLFSGIRVIATILIIGVPTAFVFPNQAIQALPFVNTERLLFVCMIGLLTLNLWMTQKPRQPWVRTEKYAFGFLCIAIASYCYAVFTGEYVSDLKKDIFYIIQYVMGFSGFIIATRIDWNKQDIIRLADILLFVGVFMAGQAVVQYFLGSDIFVPSYLEVPHATEGRATGTFANSSEYGAVAATILILGIYRYSVTNGAFIKTLIIGILGVICIAIFLSKTRAPWLAVAMSLMLITYFDRKVRPMLVFCGTIGVIAAIIVLPFFIDINTIQERFSSLAPIYNRLSLWVSGISMGLQNPVLGVGFGADGFKTAHPFYTIDIAGISAYWAKGVGIPHNEFIHILALSGFTGLYLFLATFVTAFKQLKAIALNAMINEQAKLLAVYGNIILFNFLINALFVDTGSFWYLLFLVMFIMGCAISYANHRHQAS